MDKKNTILGVLFLGAAFVLTIHQGLEQQKAAAAQAAAAARAAAAAPAVPTSTKTPALPTPTSTTAPAPAPTGSADQLASPTGTGGLVASPPASGPAATYVLENDHIKVTFTEAGGAIQTVTLKKFQARLHEPGELVFNQGASQPALGLAMSLPEGGDLGLPPVPVDARFTLLDAAHTNTSLSFHFLSRDGVEITRAYTISATGQDGDPYVIRHETRIANRGNGPLPLTRLYINTGMVPPTPEAGSLAAQYLDFGYYDGASARFISATQFSGSPGMFGGLLPFGRQDAKPFIAAQMDPGADLQWVSVKNEFFAAVLTPESGIRGNGYFTQGVPLSVDGNLTTGITGDLEVNLGILAPGQEKALALSYYVGPKEYVRLDQLGQRQDLVMEFGWMGGLSKFLLLALIAIHSALVHVSPTWAWGWAIVFFTIGIKLLTFPLTQIQVRSAKRMSQIQKPLAEIREKYKDNPQKLQTEMMELFKKNKVNPAAGCLPLLIQLPIFFAFYAMLRTASELRFASFLWIHDLSAPDTVGHVFGMSLNILPLLMAATMSVQMRLTPSPTTDNTQRKIFQLMPLIFVLSFYSMPAGMTLYWTCQNLFTIAQQMITNRMKDAPAATPPAPNNELARPVVKRR
jgi:YidC/Oxa1 family membrane protein insertase